MRIVDQERMKFFVPNDPDKAWVEIQNLSPAVEKKIDDEVMKYDTEMRNLGTAAQDVVVKPKYNQRLHNDLILKATVVAFGGFFDKDGIEIQHSSENVLKLSAEVSGFDSWIGECRELLKKKVGKQIELAEKN